MNIKDIKTKIEDGTISSEGLIFESEDTYIPMQYIKSISKLYNKDIEYALDLSRVEKTNSIFEYLYADCIVVYICDDLKNKININDFCYIICKSCKNNDFISVPKIESWQELDYAITNSSSDISSDELADLVSACEHNMFLLDNELSKFNIFGKAEQLQIFKSLVTFNQLSKSYTSTIFDFTNAILDRNIDRVLSIYLDLDHYNIDVMAVISIIKKQLRNIISVGFSKNPTEESTGLSSKQIYWIRKNLNKYTSEYIIKSYAFICDTDKLLKRGVLSSSQLLDYVLVNLL